MIINSQKQSQIELVSATSNKLDPEPSRNFQGSYPQKSSRARRPLKGEKNNSVFNIKKISATKDAEVSVDMPEPPLRGSVVEAKEFSLDDSLAPKQMRSSWYTKKSKPPLRHMQSQPAQHLNSSQYTSSTNKSGITTVRVQNADLLESESLQCDISPRRLSMPLYEKHGSRKFLLRVKNPQ